MAATTFFSPFALGAEDAEMAMDPPSLNFARGKDFQCSMREKFGHPVVFAPGFRQREFTLVVSFCRARFRLDCHTVSITLQSCFGGYPQGFRVHHLKTDPSSFPLRPKQWVLKSIIMAVWLKRILS